MVEWILSSSVLILIVAGLRLFKTRLPARVRYALWALVLVRLLVPVSVGSLTFSVGAVVQEAERTQPVQRIVEAARRPLVQSLADSPAEGLPAGPAPSGEPGPSESPVTPPAGSPADVGPALSGAPEASSETPETALTPAPRELTLAGLLGTLWAAGGVVTGGYFLWVNAHLARKLRRDRRRLEIPESKLPVYVSPQAETPCLFGLFAPKVYLSEEAAADPVVLRHTLAHEQTHFRHGDHVWALLRGVCLAVHWYNPLVWWAAVLSSRDGELACDEGALARLGEEERRAYGETLLDLTVSKPVSPLVTATMAGGSNLRERIEGIVRRPRTSVPILATLALVAALAVGCTFTGGTEDGQSDPPPSTTGAQDSTTGASTATDAPTEPPTQAPTGGEAVDWYVQEPAAPLSYADLTTKDLPYSGAEWLISGEKGSAIYEVYVEGGVLEVLNARSFGDPVHTIDLPEELATAVALGGDGRVGYVATSAQIAAVDLKTGEVRTLVEGGRLLDAVMVSYDVIYYAADTEDQTAIFRLYIPEGKMDLIYGGIPVYPASEFRLIPPETTLGKVGWTMMNPEMMALLTQEYANPDSIYKNTSPEFDFTDVWGQPGQIDTYQQHSLARFICQAIQEKSGLLALARCWYDPVKNEYTQELGAIDDCFTGTGLWHDHYDPEAEAPAVPLVDFGDWTDMGVAPLPQTREELLAETAAQDAFTGCLYAAPYARPTLYAGSPLVQILAEPVTVLENSRYYNYAITEDGALMQVSPDGSVRNTLYRAQYGELRDVDYQCGMVFLLDGDYLVQLDLTTMRQRTILEAEAMVDCRYLAENEVYICQSKGLHQMQYILNLETRSLEETFIN